MLVREGVEENTIDGVLRGILTIALITQSPN